MTVNTITYNFWFITTSNILQITFAILLSRIGNKYFKKISQSLMFLPYFVSYVILNAIVYNIFNYEVGFLNNLLTTFGMARVDVYSNPGIWRVLMVLFYLWKQVGYGTVIYLAAITGISTELYEAAEIDGANVFQQIRYITVPLLVPTFTILLLFAVGHIMRGQFDLFYQTVGKVGTLYDTTDILDTYVYRTLKNNFDIGLGTATSLYQSVFGFILIMLVNGGIRKWNPENALF